MLEKIGSEAINKLSSYNLFNYLLPGVIFSVLANKLTSYQFMQQDTIIGLFLYYFVGLVISRFGSLVLEPALKRLGVVQFANYKDFIMASEKDAKIELLSEVNNKYRTLCSMCVLLILLKLYEWIAELYPPLHDVSLSGAIFVLFILFLWSYKKQTDYVRNRVKAHTHK